MIITQFLSSIGAKMCFQSSFKGNYEINIDTHLYWLLSGQLRMCTTMAPAAVSD